MKSHFNLQLAPLTVETTYSCDHLQLWPLTLFHLQLNSLTLIHWHVTRGKPVTDGWRSDVLSSYRRYFSVLFVKLQQVCLTTRLGHLGEATRQAAGRRSGVTWWHRRQAPGKRLRLISLPMWEEEEGGGWEKQVFEGWGGEWEASRSKITPAKFL